MGSKVKIIWALLILLFFSIVGVCTYCAFTSSYEDTGSIETVELSTVFLSNADFLAKVQALDPTIVSIDKTTDLNQVTSVPTVELTDDNIVSTANSSVPTYLWVDNGVLYYFTAAVTIDINNN